jgi:metal-responsive CopG/Arc/MetJ family transcriptional regulator
MKKILVSLPDEVIKILDRELVGKVGKDHSDTLKTIIINWLSEHGYLAKGVKQKEQETNKEHLHDNETFYTS